MIQHKRVMYEEDLHKIFFNYPNLIVNDNLIVKTVHEFILDANSIVDIYIETDKELNFCEIKIHKLKEVDLYQAIRYLNYLKNHRKEVGNKIISVILIGMSISEHLKETARHKGIIIKIIGIDIPEQIKICKNCRKAYDSINLSCLFCNSTELIEVISLKNI